MELREVSIPPENSTFPCDHHIGVVELMIFAYITMMADKVFVSSIIITTETEKKILSKDEIERFCAEKLKISVEETQNTPAIVQQTKRKRNLQLAEKKAMPRIGDFVFAKVRGFSEWPAVVTQIKHPNHVWVDFFNSTEM